MKCTKFGRNGLDVSRLGLGCRRCGEPGRGRQGLGKRAGSVMCLQLRWLAMVCAVGLSCLLGQAQARAAWPDDPLALARQVVASAEHAQRPFAVVDKRLAQIFVFDGAGVLVGRSAALLGRAMGDESAPGVGLRTQQGRLRATDRTTPARRFLAEPGHKREGEAIVWLDYAAALAIHRLRGGTDHANRARRLAFGNPSERRVSAGCVVVPGLFYDSVVQPLLGAQRGLVYVMPEYGRVPPPGFAVDGS